MLFVLFESGTDRYALEARQVAEVLPLVAVKRIPQAPAGVAGIISYRGEPLPVIDLADMLSGRPARQRLSTRIVVVHYSDGGEATHLLGLIAERATETLRREAGDFVASGIDGGATPYLGPVVSDSRGMVQWIAVNKLLTASVREVLFRPSLEQP